VLDRLQANLIDHLMQERVLGGQEGQEVQVAPMLGLDAE